MGIQDRDYMHERHRAQTKIRGPDMASKPVKSASGLGKSILFFVVTLSFGTLGCVDIPAGNFSNVAVKVC
jgi:hypothetical protein